MIVRNLYIGIDPGLHGAVAAISDKGFVGVWDTPIVKVKSGKKKKSTYLPAEMVAILKNLPKCQNCLVGLEFVRAMPNRPPKRQGVVSMFSMGMGVGLWEGIIAALELPSVHIHPAVWKRVMIKSVGADKAKSIVQAQRLFPTAAEHLRRKKDDGRAEALLIAAYLREHR